MPVFALQMTEIWVKKELKHLKAVLLIFAAGVGFVCLEE